MSVRGERRRTRPPLAPHIVDLMTNGSPGMSSMDVFRNCVLTALLAAALSACSGTGPITPASTSPVTPTNPPSELSAEEDLAINPPPPQNVRITRHRSGRVDLAWDPPAAVEIPHDYSDRVVSYRIYRQGPRDIELRAIGSSTKLRYADNKLSQSGHYSYAVTSIREQNAEGTKSPAIEVEIS